MSFDDTLIDTKLDILTARFSIKLWSGSGSFRTGSSPKAARPQPCLTHRGQALLPLAHAKTQLPRKADAFNQEM
jgi:hypothetical protein